MARAIVMAAGFAALGLCCTARLRAPALGPHPTADCATTVPSAPPEPVQVDEVVRPDDPRKVWIDGFWEWRNHRWQWEPGRWHLPPTGAYYARPALIRIPVAVYGEADGGSQRVLKGYAMALMAYPGHWHLPSGQVLPLTDTSAASDGGVDGEAGAAP